MDNPNPNPSLGLKQACMCALSFRQLNTGEHRWDKPVSERMLRAVQVQSPRLGMNRLLWIAWKDLIAKPVHMSGRCCKATRSFIRLMTTPFHRTPVSVRPMIVSATQSFHAPSNVIAFVYFDAWRKPPQDVTLLEPAYLHSIQ